MGLLTPTNRGKLISLLQKLPNISDQGVRRTLLAGLPGGLVQSVNFSNVATVDLNAIVDVVDGESWAQLPDDSWSVVAVLDNAMAFVAGSRLEQDLQALKDTLQARAAGQVPAPPQPVQPAPNIAPQARIVGESGGASPAQLVKLTGKQAEELQKALLSAFQDINELQQMVRFGLGERLDEITGQTQRRNASFELIEWAIAKGRLEELVVVARERVPGNPDLRAFTAKYFEGPPVIANPGMAESVDIAIERIVNRSANFSNVEAWLSRMSGVINTICRVETPKPNGTGFLVGKDLVITNYHVVDNLLASSALSRVVLRFDYRADAAGVEVRKGVEYKLAQNPIVFKSPSKELDCVLLRVDGAPGEESLGGQNGAPARGWLTPVSQPITEKQPLFVVQHPDAQPLKIAFGTVLPQKRPDGTETPPRRVHYDIPTLGGSSGAPCFNDQWELVALHHGGENREPARFNEGIPFSDIIAENEVREALGL